MRFKIKHSSTPDPHPSTPADPASTVIVVDDDQAVLRSLSRLLRSAGLAVAAFSSAREFLEQYDPDSPGCLVLDVAMPEMSGLELQQTLIARGQELPIVFLTGHGDASMSEAAIKDGAIDFLSKPVNDEDLLRAVRAALEKDHLRRQMR
ncbi:MAG TPA: response regulator [Acidobacteriota bacterium]|nr:response regulator [Acidobacteriota bacterium]